MLIPPPPPHQYDSLNCFQFVVLCKVLEKSWNHHKAIVVPSTRASIVHNSYLSFQNQVTSYSFDRSAIVVNKCTVLIIQKYGIVTKVITPFPEEHTVLL